MKNIVVIGGGASGMMAAVAAAKKGTMDGSCKVILVEKNEKLGKKLYITGKGRCNVTNACEVETLFGNVMENRKFLYSAIYGFDNQAVMRFFEEAGCRLKIERGQRVFPDSDHSSDIIKALVRELEKAGVKVMLNAEVRKIHCEAFENLKNTSEDVREEQNSKKSIKKKKNQNAKVLNIEIFDKTNDRKAVLPADSVIVATGGLSYVLTGSTGDGYKFARKCGHTITPLSPALVPFTIKESWCTQLQGLALKNIQASLEVDNTIIYSDFGEMLFTHYGVSGPLILSAGSHYVHCLRGKDQMAAKLYLDLKPALTWEQLDKRIVREFDRQKNKQFKNAVNSLFPAKLIPIMPMLAGINPDKKVHDITKEEREHFVSVIKHLELTITGIRDYNEAIITKGGVATNEVNPSTMESKLVKGLYFAGEVLDLDALTGGFNLQIAWSTGYLAGVSAV